MDFHNLQISDNKYIDKVFTYLRQKLNRPEDAQELQEKTNVLIWGLLMSTMMRAAGRPGPNYNDKLVAFVNTNFAELDTLFDITQRLVLEINLAT